MGAGAHCTLHACKQATKEEGVMPRASAAAADTTTRCSAPGVRITAMHAGSEGVELGRPNRVVTCSQMPLARTRGHCRRRACWVTRVINQCVANASRAYTTAYTLKTQKKKGKGYNLL
jgi:hypothetical protein